MSVRWRHTHYGFFSTELCGNQNISKLWIFRHFRICDQRMSWFVFYPGISAVACRIALRVACFDTFRFRRANSAARMSAVYVAIREFFKITSRFDYLLVGFSMLPLANAVVHSPNQYTLFLCYNCQKVSVECGVPLWQWTRTNLRFSDVAVAFSLLLYYLPGQLL